MKAMLNHVLDGRTLTEAQAAELMHALADGQVGPAAAGAFLAAMRLRGETAEEIRGFARTMRALALRPRLPAGEGPTVDTCGTGGDGSHSVNLSTAVALLAAGAGCRVLKHGNRSISSKSGSADVLEVLGLPMPLSLEGEMRVLSATGFTFMFAPAHHPAMKNIMPVRRAMGVRTVFNMLGPLTNPARPDFQVVGAFSLEAARLMAQALAGLEVQRAFVLHGAEGWDEATPMGPFHLFDVRDGQVEHQVRDPADVGMVPCAAQDLAGGDAAFNAGRLRSVFERRADPAEAAHRDAILLGCGLVLECCGEAPDLAAGIDLARQVLDSGEGAQVLAQLARAGAAEAAEAPGV